MAIASINNIIIDNNILSSLDIEKLLSYIKNPESAQELLPNGDGCDFYEDGTPVKIKSVFFNWHNQDIYPTINNLIDLVKEKLEFGYGQRLSCDPRIWGRVWSEGDYQSPHSDSEYNSSELSLDIDDSRPTWNSDIPRFLADYSSLVYLNDNYDGGELVFPEYALSLKPKAGDIITFPTNAMYLHAVNKIKSGTRYNILLKWFRKTTLISNVMPKNMAIRDLVETF
jgi:hypothetical protein